MDSAVAIIFIVGVFLFIKVTKALDVKKKNADEVFPSTRPEEEPQPVHDDNRPARPTVIVPTVAKTAIEPFSFLSKNESVPLAAAFIKPITGISKPVLFKKETASS